MSQVCRSHRIGGATVLAALLLSGILPGVANARAAARPLRPVRIGVPAGVPLSDHVASLQSVSCSTGGPCVAFGWYSNKPEQEEEAMAVTETGGAWGVPSRLVLPTDGVLEPSSVLEGLSCNAPGVCAAVVSYMTPSGAKAIVLSQLDGVWGVAGRVEPPFPSSLGIDAVVGRQSCLAVGVCVAFSTYNDSAGRGQLAVVSQTAGVWGVTRRVALPSNASANPHPKIGPASCGGLGRCAALGTYDDTAGVRHAMALSESQGVWGKAREVLFPRDAGTPAYRNLGRNPDSISCSMSGVCAAIGSYHDKANREQLVVVSRVRGVWGTARKVVLPGPSSVGLPLELNSVSCARSGYCAAVGSYADRIGRQHAIIVAETDGRWGAAQRLLLPPGAGPEASGATLYSVSCTASGACVAVGSYEDTYGNGHTMIVSEVHGRWGAARNVGPPLDLQLPAERVGGLTSVSCPPSGPCAAAGSNSDGGIALTVTPISP